MFLSNGRINLAETLFSQILNRMGEWCVEHHGQSGLTDKVKKSTLNLEQCEKEVLEFISPWAPKGKCCLAGNSVGQDKKFLDKYMPKFSEHLHYRIIDVSTVKELVKRWYPEDFSEKPKKKLTHRALDDILESIDELKYYKTSVFKSIEKD